MIERYTREEMKNIWDLNSKYNFYLQVELAACQAYYEDGKIPKEDFENIKNNAKFDLKFLNYYLEALNLEPITNYICTLEMLKQVKSYNGKNKKLETACSYYNIENKNAHRADSDTLATAKLFLTIKDKI